MNLQAVIFDLDGTLIDSMGVWDQVDKQFLGKRNIKVPADLFKEIKSGNSYREIALYFKKRFNLPESVEEIMTEWTEMVSFYYRNVVLPKPGVFELLDYIREHNVRLGLGTSNCLSLTEAVLQRNRLNGYFQSIVVGCTEIRGKPYPDIFLQVAAELRTEPENCLVVEDVLVGIQAAQAAGMKVAAIYDDFSESDQLVIRTLADFHVMNFHQLLQLIKREYSL
ncbi:MAG: HAD family phosphatase [Candidatus Cloacimonetes bacterium]|nr:HAD family phosphatase [Candidatus Cloacimonadota bacterium]